MMQLHTLAMPNPNPTCRQLIQEQLPIRKDQLYNTYGPKGAIPLIPGEWRPQGQELDRLLCAWPSQRRVEGAARTECMHSPQIMCVLRLLSSSATVAFPCPQTPSPSAPRCAWAACSRAAAHLWRWANTAQGLPAAAGCTLSVGSSPVSSPLAASLLMALPAPFHTQSSPSHPRWSTPTPLPWTSLATPWAARCSSHSGQVCVHKYEYSVHPGLPAPLGQCPPAPSRISLAVVVKRY